MKNKKPTKAPREDIREYVIAGIAFVAVPVVALVAASALMGHVINATKYIVSLVL